MRGLGVLEWSRQREPCVRRPSCRGAGYSRGIEKRGLEPRDGWEHVVSWQPREECFKGLGSNVNESQEKDEKCLVSLAEIFGYHLEGFFDAIIQVQASLKNNEWKQCLGEG